MNKVAFQHYLTPVPAGMMKFIGVYTINLILTAVTTTIEEMAKFYLGCSLKILRRMPIERCPIFTSLHGVLCGNCSLLSVCNHGKRNIRRNKKKEGA